VAIRRRWRGECHPVRLSRPLRIERLQKGDVGYIPQGYGHSIENAGSGTARILIGFNPGIYETIDLSQWIAANPKDSPQILASQRRGSGNSRIATCSLLTKMAAGRRGRQAQVKTSTDLAAHRIDVARANLAQAIGVKRVGQEYAKANEDEECRHDLGHNLPPCVAMPERARLRNSW
jgi:hypothetical protein